MKEGIIMFCSNCGMKLNEGAKFCCGCGSPVVGVVQNSTYANTNIMSNDSKSVMQANLHILKCPTCGNAINETTAKCPACGLQFTGRNAISSVQAFKEQLMTIENSRIGGIAGAFLGGTMMVDPAEKKKLSLIQSFPIPNTVDDIYEFMVLAIANIDVSLSKNTVMNKWNSNNSTMETSMSIKRTISNAWVSKMQQVYQKAAISFPNSQEFCIIQEMYTSKMKELKLKS